MSEKLCVKCSSSEISPEGIYGKELDRWVGKCSEQQCVLGQENQQKEGERE